MQTPPRRVATLSALAAVLGLAGGGAAWLLVHLIAAITNLAFRHRITWSLPSFVVLEPGPALIPIAVGGAVIVSMIAKWAPMIRGHGIPETMEAVLVRHSRIGPRAALAKPLSAAVAIGTGGPFGAEGPIIMTGGALGSLLGQLVRTSPAERKILLAAGSAAGMAAVFGAPLASVVLAIELLLFEFSTRAFVPLVVAASVAGGVHSALFGSGPLFRAPSHGYAGLDLLPAFAVLGLLCGLAAVVISRGLFFVEDLYRRLPFGEFWHPLVGAALFALIGLLVPHVLGVGYDVIEDVLHARLALDVLATVFVAKMVAWWVALGSGTSGGTLAPVLLMGGAFGGMVGGAALAVWPDAPVTVSGFALVGMAATFGAATRATFTSIVFLFELTQDYRIILPLMLATVLADLVAGALTHDSVLTEKLTRRGLRVARGYSVDVLGTTNVRDVMTRSVETLDVGATVADARARFATGRHSAYPLVDPRGACVGIVSRGDLLHLDDGDDEPLAAVAAGDVVTVGPSDTVLEALRRMLEEGVEHIPVIDDGRLVGICTRTDVMRARRRELDYERVQLGWASRRAAVGN